MATYESLIKIKGSVGDLVFYSLNGKNVVRRKSGFNKTAYKKSPSYEKVRQNSSEFGHCSKIGKMIRQALDIYIKEADDPLLYQKFAKLMTAIKDLDAVSERGRRSVEKGLGTEKGKLLLKDFQFGIIPNIGNDASVSPGLWDKSIHLNKKFSADESVVMTIKVDFDNYLTEVYKENLPLRQQDALVFEKHFSDDDFLLYFVILKKKEEIKNMGFV